MLTYIVTEGPKRTRLNGLDRVAEYARLLHAWAVVVDCGDGTGAIMVGDTSRVLATYAADIAAAAKTVDQCRDDARSIRTARAYVPSPTP